MSLSGKRLTGLSDPRQPWSYAFKTLSLYIHDISLTITVGTEERF